MLIACKCLNILLKSASDLPSIHLSTSNYDVDDNTITSNTTNQLQFIIQHQTSSPLASMAVQKQQQQQQPQPQQTHQLQQSTLEKLKEDHLQFFKTAKVSTTSILPTIQHTDLVNVTLIENWNVHTCMHCKTVTDAQAKDSTKVLLNPLLLINQEKINIIKTQKNFSKSFKIVLLVNSDIGKETNANEKMNNKVHSGKLNNKTVVTNGRSKNLLQYLQDMMQTEMEATEERIERYAKQQRSLLTLFLEKAEQDYENILRALDNEVPDGSFTEGSGGGGATISNDTTQANSLSANAKLLADLTPPVTPDSTPMSIGNSPNFKQQTSFLLINQNPANNKQASKFNHSTPEKTYQLSQRSNAAHIDDDIFFEMDGLDATVPTDGSSSQNITQSEDEDDVNDNDDLDHESTIDSRGGCGTKISSSRLRKNVPKVCVAQSLPMAVPIFKQRNDDDYEEHYTEDNVDIAASIKALAKSVHGEAIFGDLPRPRFSTQI